MCELGFQLRPHVVWFGEPVPMIEKAAEIVETADLLVVIGSSLSVYPAAGLVHAVRPGVPVVLVDPEDPEIFSGPKLYHIKKLAAEGVTGLVDQLLQGLQP